MTLITASTISDATAALEDAPSPVVVIPVFNSYEDVALCLEAVFAYTDRDTAILIVDDAGRDRRFADLLKRVAGALDHHVVVLEHAANEGFVGSCNAAFASTPGRDVVLLNSDVIVGPEWLERLSAAAHSSPTVATASSLTNNGTILTVRSNKFPGQLTPTEAARCVAAASLRLRPPIPTAVGHCCYVKRDVLDLLGGFDEAFSPGYGEEVDFSQRAVAHGFRHVCADDVFTYHRGGASFSGDADAGARRLRHEGILNVRYPWYVDWVRAVESDLSSPLAHAISTAQRALSGIQVGVDAMCLGPDRMGTQRIVVDTIRSLAERPEISRLVAFVPLHPPSYVADLTAELPEVEFIGVNPVLGAPDRVVDIIYRPYQVRELAELDFLYQSAHRFIVNQLDTIAYENPAYFRSATEWLHYRDVTKLTLELAHGIAFLSAASREAASAIGLVASSKPTAVVHCGPSLDRVGVEDERSPPSLGPDDRGFLLALGTSYLHKNRPFALAIAERLLERGWNGRLVLAGPHPPHGNSLAREAEFLMTRPQLRDAVVSLGSVSEQEKRWLLRRSVLVLYPSVTEGFGLVPFEAAGFDVPTLSSRRGGLGEALGPQIETLESFDLDAAADRAWQLLMDPDAAATQVRDTLARSDEFTWQQTSDHLIGLFFAVLEQPRGRTIVLEGESAAPTGLASRAQRQASPPMSRMSERLIAHVIKNPELKGTLSPDGSRRQRYARQVIAKMRDRGD